MSKSRLRNYPATRRAVKAINGMRLEDADALHALWTAPKRAGISGTMWSLHARLHGT